VSLLIGNAASLNKSAATAEASTTLTTITVGTDQSRRFARGLQTKPTHFGQDFRRRNMLILESSRFDDRKEFTFQGPVMPPCTLLQPLHDMIRGILD
jgi:hypothetical protein